MTSDLELATRTTRVEEGVFEGSVPDGWQQGRGAFGGLTIAALVRAIEAFAGTSDRTLRSLTAELPGPTLVGAYRVRVEPIRVGSAQSTLAARLIQEGATLALCTAVLGRPRAASAGEFIELDPPALRPWRELTPLAGQFGGPTFAQHFEYRIDGPLPFSGSPSAQARGWVRPRHAHGPISSSAYLAAMCDTFWPASFSRMTTPHPMATVAYTLQILEDAPRFDPAVPLAYRAQVWVQRQGYFVEQRELWDERGQLLALNQQTFAVIK